MADFEFKRQIVSSAGYIKSSFHVQKDPLVTLARFARNAQEGAPAK